MKIFTRTAIFTILIPGAVLIYVPWLILHAARILRMPPLGAFRFLGIPLIALYVAVYLSCAWDFGTRGEGTPAIYDPPRKLVRDRLYSLVRNPMYIAVTLALFGEALLFESYALAIYACIVFVGFCIFVAAVEEPYLRRAFGHNYAEYCRQVPRWIPRFH